MPKRRLVYSERQAVRKTESYLWPIANRAFNQEMLPVLKSLEDQNVSAEIKACLRKYLIISLVTTIERFFWNAASRNIDLFNADMSRLVEGTITIPLHALDTISEGKVTKGGIIASNFNFQNPQDIQSFFSKVLNIDFFEVIKAMDKNDPYNYVKGAANLTRNWKNFLEMFELRNRIVHANETVKLSDSQLRSLVNCTMNFLDAAVLVSDLSWKDDLLREIGLLKQKGLLT